MCQLLKIDSILECIVGCVAICNVNCNVVVVTVCEVDAVAVISRCAGTCRYFVGVGVVIVIVIVIVVVSFNPNVVKSTLAPISVAYAHSATPPKRICKPTPAHVPTIFQSRALDALCHVAKLVGC